MKRFIIGFILILALIYALLWVRSKETYDVDYGISFNHHHASSLGLEWKAVYKAMIDELGPEHIRIAAMWSEIEAEKGNYNFDNVDWMMNQASNAQKKITLVIGQKAPRWPECHVPQWIHSYGATDAEEHLYDYIRQTVERYKNHPALHMWQVENEAFIEFQFGECEGFLKDAIYNEIDIVRELDPERKILVTDSGELGLWTKAGHAADVFGTTLYRVVRTPGGHIINYDWVPAAFYRYKARLLKIDLDRFIVAELQAEPWFNDSTPTDTSIEEMEETMNPARMLKHMDYTERIGISQAYLWGVEWWYFMKEVHNDSRYWDIAIEAINQ